MKVFYLDDIPTPYRLGVFKGISEKIDGQFRVGFCADSEPGRTWTLNFDGIEYEVIKGFQWRPPFQLNPFSIKLNLGVIGALKSFKPDIVIMSGYTHPTVFLAVAYCISNKIPFGIVSETNEYCSVTSGFRWLVKKIIISPITKYMSFGLPTGSQAENYYKKLGCKNIPYFHFPNTPDIRPIEFLRDQVLSNSKDVDNKKKYDLEMNIPIILFVGRLISAKNPIELISAFINCSKKAILVIVGAGEQDNTILKLSENRSDIKRIPWLEKPSEVYELMCISDIFVLPSIHEPWGAVVNEAMAAGCCVVTSNKVGSAYDLIEHGKSGYIYNSGDVAQLSDLLNMLIDNKKIRMKISSEGRKSASYYSQDYAVENFIKAVNHIEKNVS